jgi:hypothetical protein
MIIEVVMDGEQRNQSWNKRQVVGVLLNMYVPADETERWIVTNEAGTRLWPHERVGDMVSDGERVFITRKPGEAA